MESRIILSQADFSQNNIGRYVELSDFTKKVLSKQTQYDEQSSEAAALNTFLDQLTTDGFIGGSNPLLLQLMIPGLAGSHDELLYDIAHLDVNGYPTNMMAQTELEAAENLQVYRPVIDGENRIVAVKRYANYNDMGSDVAAAQARANIENITFKAQNSVHNADQNSFSIIGALYATNSASSTPGNRYLGNTSGTLFIKPENVANISGSTTRVGYTFSTAPQKSFLINYNKDSVRFEGLIDGVAFTGNTSETPIKYATPAQNPGWNTLWIGDFSYSTFTKMSLIALGNFIPTEKRAALQGYIDTFLTAIHANI